MKTQRGFLKLFLLLVLVTIGAFGFLIYKRYGTVNLSFLERTPPTIQSSTTSIGIGADVTPISIMLEDSGAGLDEVVVRIDQGGKVQDLFRKSFDAGVTSETISLDISAKEKNLKEGEAQIRVSVFDKSFWNNGSTESFSAFIDYTKPRVEVLTGQHNVAVGGVELVFYRLKGDDIAESGVRVGTNTFKGSKASSLDPEFEKFPDIYFSFFALPYNFDKAAEKLSVYARDKVGNTASSTFGNLIIPKKYRDAAMTLSDNFLVKVFDELLPLYYAAIQEVPPTFSFENLSDAEKIEKFKLINESYRGLLLKKLSEVLAESEEEKLWTAPWVRPMSAAPTSSFAETRTYTLNGTYASTSLHAGVDLADVANAPVKAANRGKVVFADNFGIYGNAVVIDHGFGLSTLYGHLSSISVNVGDEVQKEAPIGRSGATGLAGGDHLHFEFRLRNVPIMPIEWWDGAWIREHIEKKIQSVKDQVNAQAAMDAQVR